MLIAVLISVAVATEAERNLHKRLFDPETYNPRVILAGVRYTYTMCDVELLCNTKIFRYPNVG